VGYIHVHVYVVNGLNQHDHGQTAEKCWSKTWPVISAVTVHCMGVVLTLTHTWVGWDKPSKPHISMTNTIVHEIVLYN